MERDSRWIPPDAFEEYELLRPLGHGAMGQVYVARDRLLDREVAIKFIAAPQPKPGARERFFREARAIARLQHPNVVAIFRVGEIDGRPFLVSEYVRGQPLSELDIPLAPERLRDVALGLARGLAAAHRRGVLHRDIKPANAMLGDDGAVKLLDFGLAKLSQDPVGDGGDGGDSGDSGDDMRPDLGHEPAVPRAARLAETLPDDAQDADAGAAAQTALAETLPEDADDTGAAADRADEDAPADPGLVRSPALAPPMSTALAFTPLGGLLTGAGQLVGTPLYMPPELWRQEPATPRSDLYSLGVLLYELAAGRLPHEADTIEALRDRVTDRDAPPLAQIAPRVPADLAAAIERCVARDPAARFASASALRDALERAAAHPARAAPTGDPYRGLHRFEVHHSGQFFGRDADILAVLDRLRGDPVVVVTGDSGVGKSSLCRAGVAAAVEDGRLGDDRAWTVAALDLGRLGDDALAALAATLAPLANLSEREMARELAADPRAAALRLRRQLGDSRGLLLLLDPLGAPPGTADASAHAIADALAALAALAANASGVRLLVTIRGDHLAHAASLPGLGDELTRSLYFLQPLSGDALRQAIAAPAAQRGVAFETDAMIDDLAREASAAPGGLPLLQFTLAELWQTRDRDAQLIRADALASVGGVGRALARHADRVLARMPPAQRTHARRLLVALIDDDGRRVRRSLRDVCGDQPDAVAALEALVQSRLISARERDGDAVADDPDSARADDPDRDDPDDEPGVSGADGVYEIAHDALLSSWDTLRLWLTGDAALRVVHRRLARAARDWSRLGRRRDDLWTARQIADAAALDRDVLGADERAFLGASRRAARRQRALRIGAIALIPTLLAAGWVGLRWQARAARAAKVRAVLADARAELERARVTATAAGDLRARALARFDAHDFAAAEPLWAEALATGRDADARYRRADRILEHAFSIDPNHGATRRLLADSLEERARRAARVRDSNKRDELLERLETYAPDRLDPWRAPVRVAIATDPDDAAVALWRYELGEDERYRQVAMPAPRPAQTASLDPGSYVIVASAPGRAAVRYPVWIEREPPADREAENAAERSAEVSVDLTSDLASEQTINLWLPPATAVPPGFVYIPAGESLLGSADDEGLRQTFLRAAPLRTVKLDAYLIARTEVTFAAWIEYLEALPPAERDQRTPNAGVTPGAAMRQGLALTRDTHGDGDGGVWRVSMQRASRTLTARAGEPLHYPDRDRRADQDWLRTPVAGISFEDAQAYARWLDATDRVPGARLCNHLEWARAARGADGRRYPGGERLDPADADIDATYGRRPLAFGADEVGSYERSRSPFGLYDMAGNVWEWVASAADGSPMFRGGSWYQGVLTAQSANRESGEPSMRSPLLGVRLCADPPAP